MNKKFYSLIAAAFISVAAFAEDGYSVSIKDAKVEKNATENPTLEIEMTNVDLITCVQTEIFLPTELSVVWDDDEEAYLCDLERTTAKKHAVSLTPQKGIDDTFPTEFQEKGNSLAGEGYSPVRMLVYSGTNKTFSGNEGTIVTFPVKVKDPGVDGTYTIWMWTQSCVIPEGAVNKLQGWTSSTLTVGEGTGINGIIESADSNAPVYNLNGQRVNKAQKGVFIQNGKKVAKK